MPELTSNQHYGGLNRRFDRRAARLRKLGFSYAQIAPHVAGFVRRRYGKQRIIPCAVLLYADNRSWFDTLRGLLH